MFSLKISETTFQNAMGSGLFLSYRGTIKYAGLLAITELTFHEEKREIHKRIKEIKATLFTIQTGYHAGLNIGAEREFAVYPSYFILIGN